MERFGYEDRAEHHASIWRYAGWFFVIWLPLVFALVVAFWTIYQTNADAALNITRNEERQSIQLADDAIAAELGMILGDIHYLAKQSSLHEWLDSGTSAAYARLTSDFLTFAKERGLFDQIRLLDQHGQEIVRINSVDGQLRVVSPGELQNKAGRYYIKETLALAAGKVFVSPFDLNVEHNEIEQPIKPMIRFSTQVFGQKGRLRGIIVLNYLGQRLLDRLSSYNTENGGGLWLLNTDGYWLLGPSAEVEWAFMSPERKAIRFSTQYRAAWERMMQGPVRSQFMQNGNLFSYAKVALETAPGDNNLAQWVLVGFVPSAAMSAKQQASVSKLAVLFIALAVLIAILSAVIAYHIVRRQLIEDRVRSSEVRFRGLLEFAPDAIVIVDQSGIIVMINKQAENWFGYAYDELHGQVLEQLIPERFRQKHRYYLNQYIAQPFARPMGKGADLFGLRKDGSEFPVEISLSPLETRQGMLVTSIIRDISQRKFAENQILMLNSALSARATELEAINHELEAFSYSVSHDLRAPLRAIDGFSRILVDDYAALLDEKGKDRLSRVRTAAQHMAGLIDDLLKLSRVSRTELKIEPVDFSALVENVCQELVSADSQRQVKFSVQAGLSVLADVSLLKVVLDNLIGNAWKFTSKREDAHIEVGAVADTEVFTYFVRDNGAGFDMTYADKLFGAFQRLHDTSEFPGTGIGLATVQRVINKHGGQVWAEAEVGSGATFYFTLEQVNHEK